MTGLSPTSSRTPPDDMSPLLRASPRTLGVLRGATWVCVAVITLAAISVLVGWAMNIAVLKNLGHPARIAMNPATAIGFLLACVSLSLLTPAPVSPRRRKFANRLAWLLLAIGAAKMLTLLDVPIEVDKWLFPDRLGANAMAPNTAIAFMLVAISLLATDTRLRKRHPTPLIALGGIALSLAALLGYAYDISALYRVSGFIPMALNSAVCFFLLSVAILASRPELPPLSTVLSDSVGGLLARRLLPAAILTPALIGLAALAVMRRGGSGPELAVLLFTLATMCVFVGLTAWTADRLHKLDYVNRQTLRRLQRAEAVYHSLVETLPQNIFRKDMTGRFTFGNNNFCKTLGRNKDQIAGATDFDFYTPELAARYRLDDLEVARSGRTQDVVEEHITPAGNHLYVQVIKTPVRSAENDVIGVQGIFWDVTDRVMAQQELERKNKLLEKVNSELEDANNQLGLANARLYETNLQLEQANVRLEQAVASERAAREQLTKTQTHLVQSEKMVGLGQMVAGVAHEINNPLAFVTNNVAVLQRDVKALGALIDLYRSADGQWRTVDPSLMGEIDELAESIDVQYTRDNLDDLIARSREGLRRIQQIVRDLRDFVRLDESELQEVDLNEGVNSTLNIIQGHAKKTNIRLETDLGPLPKIICYPAKLNQVIMNLVSNAVDASPEGGMVLLRTRAVQEESAGTKPDHVVLEVVDTGCGIDPAVRQRIFDPFFTTKPVGRGTGLGLSISYGIVRDHGGRIEVDSELGKGTTFRVTLPLTGPAKEDADRVKRQAARTAS